MSSGTVVNRLAEAEVNAREELRVLLKPHRRILALAGGLAGVAAATEVLIIAFVAAFTERLVSNTASVPYLSGLSNRTLALATFAAICFKIMVDWTLAKVNSSAQCGFESKLRRDAAVLQSQARWEVIEDSEPGALHSLMWNSAAQARNAFSQMLSLISNLCSLLFMLMAAILSAGVLALAGAVGIVAFAVIFRPLNKAAKRAGARLKSSTRTYGAGLNEDIRMSREIRVLGAQSVVAEKLAESGSSLARAAADQLYLSSILSSGYSNAVYAVALAGFVAISLSGSANPAPMAALVLLLYRSLIYGRSVQGSMQGLSSSAPFVADVNNWLERMRSSAESQVGSQLPGRFENIAFKDVGLRYANGTVGLQHLNLELHAGEAVAVIGPSGSGKSTFVSLILALREASSGVVSVNGMSLADVDKVSWRSHLSLVPQESLLFDATVEENVKCWRAGVTQERVLEALRQAHVLDEVLARPEGIHSQVGEGGRRLSGGQRQRVCLARALAGDPELLVLDEPTSALDAASERAVKDSLEDLKGKVTLVIVAHRMSTIAVCDRVLVFDGGGIENDADPATALKESTFFAQAIQLSE